MHNRVGLKYFTLTLHPTCVKLDVIVGGTSKAICKHMSKTYGGEREYYKTTINNSFCGLVEFEGADRIIMVLRDPHNIPVIAHEALHATWKLDSLVHLNLNINNQEIQAYYVSYIVEEILKRIT